MWQQSPEAPSIYGIAPVEESEYVETWVDRAHVDRFISIVPKTWDTMLSADRSQNYNFMNSMKPAHIIQENKAIPVFFFECFMQENMAKLLDTASEKSCLFEYTEADGLGMIHCLLEMYRIRREILSLDEEKAFGLCASYF